MSRASSCGAALVVVALPILITSPGPLGAQRRVALPQRVACERCAIDVAPLVALGTDSGPGMLTRPEPRAWRDSRGQFLVVNPYESAVQVFGPDGRFMRRFGRRGAGPGEFEGVIALAVDASDSVHVIDAPARRYSVFSPAYDFVRSAALPLDPQIAFVRTPQFLAFNAPIHTRELIGLPVHVVSPLGEYLRSTGSESGLFRPDIPNLERRALAPSSADTIWSAHRAEYVIDRIDLATGRTTASLSRRAEWFPPGGVRSGSAGGEPYTFLVDVHEDRTGLLWVLVAVPDREWRSAVQASRPGDLHPMVTDDHRYRDTMLEVIDVRRGVVLQSVRLPQYVHQFVADGILASTTETDAGEPRLQLWRFALRQP
jgi:hypothetical protein